MTDGPYHQPQPPYDPTPPARPPVHYPPQPSTRGVAAKASIGTIAVIATLIGIFCVLPAIVCGIMVLIGGVGSTIDPTPTP